MQVFSELSHAFVVARFYEELESAFGNRGTEAFAHMTTVYARQRGSRMAQRAIRDGKPLDFTSYRIYGEWQKTEAAERVTGGFAGRTVSIAPDHEEYIEACPWAWQFKEMGASECGVLYCTHLDRGIASGFNPDLVFEVPQSINDHDYCIQIMRGAHFSEEQTFEKDPANVRGFDYHTGHVYKTFRLISESIFGSEGRTVADKVLEDFRAEYGPDMAKTLCGYMDTDFQVI